MTTPLFQRDTFSSAMESAEEKDQKPQPSNQEEDEQEEEDDTHVLKDAWRTLRSYCLEQVRAACVTQMIQRLELALEKLYVTGVHSEFRALTDRYTWALNRFLPAPASTAAGAVDVTSIEVSLPGDEYALMKEAEPLAYDALHQEALEQKQKALEQKQKDLIQEYQTVYDELQAMKVNHAPDDLINIPEKQLERIEKQLEGIDEELDNLLVRKPTQESIDQQRVSADVAVPLTVLKKLINRLITLWTALMRRFNSELRRRLRSTASHRPSPAIVQERVEWGIEELAEGLLLHPPVPLSADPAQRARELSETYGVAVEQLAAWAGLPSADGFESLPCDDPAWDRAARELSEHLLKGGPGGG